MPLPGRTLKLHTLSCTKTEDWTGSDECRLEISVDGVPLPPIKHDLNDGESWSLNQTLPFIGSVTVVLYDEDWPDGDDRLGEVRIDTTIGANRTGKFTLDEADFTLAYSVEELIDTTVIDPTGGLPTGGLPTGGLPIPLPVSVDFSALVAAIAGLQAALGGIAGVGGGTMAALGSIANAVSGLQSTLSAIQASLASLNTAVAGLSATSGSGSTLP